MARPRIRPCRDPSGPPRPAGGPPPAGSTGRDFLGKTPGSRRSLQSLGCPKRVEITGSPVLGLSNPPSWPDRRRVPGGPRPAAGGHGQAPGIWQFQVAGPSAGWPTPWRGPDNRKHRRGRRPWRCATSRSSAETRTCRLATVRLSRPTRRFLPVEVGMET